jgi:hypothetical protein
MTAQPPAGPVFHQPYREEHLNDLYNLLFCDNLELFRPDGAASTPLWATLLAAETDPGALQAIAGDEAQESRVRALAYNRLRAAGHPVPARVLLGVIVEVPLEQGMDTLAAYADGRVRYLNQSGGASIFEGGPPEIEALARALVAVSQPLVARIGPWDRQRLPPPRAGNVRLTFLVSDGLYFGEAPFQAMAQDSMGGPVLAKATELLQLVVAATPPGKG